MTYAPLNTQSGLILPITSAARQLAQQFAMPFTESPLQQQVYRNTLAIMVVRDYLQLMGVETDLKASECWDPLLRLTADVSDLYLPGLGNLECRGVEAGETVCSLPADVLADRIGYVVVEIHPQQRRAKLLGFTPIGVPQLSIRHLQSLEALLRHLYQLRQPQTTVGVSLSQWFNGILDQGWQTLETLVGNSATLAPSFRTYAFRDTQTSVQAGKLVNLNLELESQSVVLLIALTPAGQEQIGVQVQIHPTTGGSYLPANMELAVLSETGETLKRVRSRRLDNYMQLPFFQGYPGEQFQLALYYNQVHWTERFSI